MKSFFSIFFDMGHRIVLAVLTSDNSLCVHARIDKDNVCVCVWR